MHDRYYFEHAVVTVDHDQRWVTTEFDDGTKLAAVPKYDSESMARADALGYRGYKRDAIWNMTQDHDLFHVLVAESMGRTYSVALHHVATGKTHTDETRIQADEEERMVLLLQHCMNDGRAILPPKKNFP